MSISDCVDDSNPIDITEHIAEHNAWEFDRLTDDQIAMAIEGQWRTYSVTVAWSGHDETLRMVCTYDVDPPEEKLPQLYHMLNVVNDQCWTGSYNYWLEQKLMVYRYSLLLTGTDGASPEQVDVMIQTAVATAERYFPAFQLVIWGDSTPQDAIQVALAEAYGRA